MAPRKTTTEKSPAKRTTSAAPPPITRGALADELLVDADRLRRQLFAPVVIRKPMLVSDGDASGSHVEIVDVELTEPTFADKKLIVAAIGIAVDKLTSLDPALGKEGTEDAVDEVAQRREARRSAATPMEPCTGSDR